jgi:hypothetical protein
MRTEPDAHPTTNREESQKSRGARRVNTFLASRFHSIFRPVILKNRSRSLSGLLNQAVFVMQAARHRFLRNTEIGWQLVSVAARRNFVLGRFG